jgi:hypothetical protein
VTIVLHEPIEFQRRRPLHKTTASPATVAELEANARSLLDALGESPQPYELNLARLRLADRFEQLRRVTRKRDAGKLTAAFTELYAQLYDRLLAAERPELAPRQPPTAPMPHYLLPQQVSGLFYDEE